MVSGTGVATDPSKTKAVKDWPQPRDVHEVRSFLGLASYYRSFVQDFATVAKPLFALSEKSKQFVWSEECQDSFEELKEKLTTSPVLAYPLPEGELIMDTDASDVGLGAVLSQMQTGDERVLSYASRTLDKPEKNYCVTRREMLAVIFGLRKFKHYLLGRRVRIRTDHASLRWVTQFKEPEGQVARWLEELSSYDFQVEHRPGKSHGNADGLSRIPCRQCGWGKEEDVELCRVLRSEGARTRSQSSGLVEEEEREKDCEERYHSQGARPKTGQRPGTPEKTPAEEPGAGTGVAPRPGVPGDRAGWRTAQEADAVLTEVRRWVQGDGPPADIGGEGYEVKSWASQYERLELEDGVLGRIWTEPLGGERFQIAIPRSMRSLVLGEVHGAPLVSHFGQSRTQRRLQEEFYWPGYARDVILWCASCPQCLQGKDPPRRNRAAMGHVRTHLPMERVAMDVMGPLPRTRRGNKFILVVMDYCTRWAEAFPLPTQEAEKVADAFVEGFVCRFGTPRVVHTDKGTNFTAEVTAAVMRLLQTQRTHTCAFRPQSDGLVERLNRTIEAMLTMVVGADQRNWDEKLPYVLSAYRSSMQASTNQTPNALMLGREVGFPLEAGYPLEGWGRKGRKTPMWQDFKRSWRRPINMPTSTPRGVCGDRQGTIISTGTAGPRRWGSRCTTFTPSKRIKSARRCSPSGPVRGKSLES